jgi:hypothetical protein
MALVPLWLSNRLQPTAHVLPTTLSAAAWQSAGPTMKQSEHIQSPAAWVRAKHPTLANLPLSTLPHPWAAGTSVASCGLEHPPATRCQSLPPLDKHSGEQRRPRRAFTTLPNERGKRSEHSYLSSKTDKGDVYEAASDGGGELHVRAYADDPDPLVEVLIAQVGLRSVERIELNEEQTDYLSWVIC